jgi:hypothetical protein
VLEGLGPFLMTTRSRDDPLFLLWGLLCTFRCYWASLGYRRMRRWLSQNVRRSVRSRRMAGRFARSERVPGHIPANSPLRPLSPMESAIHDVCPFLNPPGVNGTKIRPGFPLLHHPHLPRYFGRDVWCATKALASRLLSQSLPQFGRALRLSAPRVSFQPWLSAWRCHLLSTHV